MSGSLIHKVYLHSVSVYDEIRHCYCSVLILNMLLATGYCYGQQASVAGMVKTESGEVVPGVYITIADLNLGTVTDQEGRFNFQNLQSGSYVLHTSSVGFQPKDTSITITDGRQFKLNLKLTEEQTELNEVVVTGKSGSRQLRESTASVSVLQTKELYIQNNNTSDLIGQISGVNVRQTGGFGSSAEVYINGMSGKQIKFFLDGIPLSYFGSGLGLNVLPVNMMEQIEVYKGVVPVELGADALGGAINIISRKSYFSYLDASLSVGSFNTRKANLNAQYVIPAQNMVFGINSFFNHSDNNYKVDIEIPDEFGNPEPAGVRRFHDRFSNYLLNVYTGVFNKKYADRLIVSARYSGLADEIQHNAVMTQPYGEVRYDESTLGFSLEYEKEEILPATRLKWYGGMNQSRGHFTDTTLNAYTWNARVYDRRTNGGEISASGNLLNLTSQNAVSRLNLHYRIQNKGAITLNAFSSWFTRRGKDPVAATFYGQDYYANPVRLFKNALGLAYEHTFSQAFVSYTALKHFSFVADGYAIQNMEFFPNSQSVSNIGFSQSFRHKLTEQLLAKASYEYATRLPDELELFGDLMLVRPNPFLKPEQSHNANLGLQVNSGKIKVGVNSFYRLTDHIIWLRTSQFFAQYQNLLKASIKGVDAEMEYQLFPFLSMKANATWQETRNRSPKSVTGSVDNRYYNARLPNIPYLFGNGEIRYTKDQFLSSKNSFSAWWSAAYVHEFFLFWAADGNKDLKNTIPAQFIQNAGISYALQENNLSIALESNNIFDRKAFDNFSVQRPGRAFYITLRTFLH